MEYAAPTAGLIIAAVLFIIGILSVNDLAARDFKITISGKVGPFQRGVLVAASVLCLVLSVAGFYLLTNRPSGSGNPPSPPSQSAPAQQWTIKVSTFLPDGVSQQSDKITIGSEEQTLSVDANKTEASNVFHFEGDPGDVDYAVEATQVSEGQPPVIISGQGRVFADSGRSFFVWIGGDPMHAELREST
jgi:hypothetical protein